MAEAETQEEVTDKGAVNVVKLIEDQNSYINSAKERMNDVISALVNNAENSIALNDFSQIFKTVTVWIKFRPRKLGQYVEIMKERTTETTISIRYSDDIYIPHIKEVLKEHKIKMVSNEQNVMLCKTPRPSDQDIEIAVQKVKVLANTARSSLSQGKAAEIQRLQAALKNEYLEAKDVKYAITSIEKIEEKFATGLTYSRIEAEKKIRGKLLRYASNEAKDIELGLTSRGKKNYFIEN